MGDLLFPLGDIIDRGAKLPAPGYVEEWWGLELNEKLKITGENIANVLEKESGGTDLFFNISLDKAIQVSEKYSLPLYPKYIFYWKELSTELFNELMNWLKESIWRTDIQNESENTPGKLVLPWENQIREKYSKAKRALELAGIEHQIVLDNIVLDKDALPLLANFGILDTKNLKEKFENILEKNDKTLSNLENINSFSKYLIKDKSGSFIGTRMGRPEKAKLRKLTGSPNALFPISNQGGRFRSVQEAVSVGYIKSDWPLFKCLCGNETIFSICDECGQKTKKIYYCRECKSNKDKPCEEHEESCFTFSHRKIDSKKYFDYSRDLLGYKSYDVPPLIKGVRGTSSDGHDFEHLSKGILRAKFNLAVNKDGTIRYDGTEIPLTHFRPIEIRTSVEKLKELGYLYDIYGNELGDENQLIELKPHDVVLPSCPVTHDEKADDVFFNIANFVDEELSKLYNLPKYYNLKTKGDLVGQLVVCMAPHNCAGVIGRVIGFNDLQGLTASPYMHAAMRRDCDGDEAAVMMLMDVLINFSRKFLPSHRGGTQDAPLVLNARIRAGEVDDQILTLETCDHYPLEVYKLAEQEKGSGECDIETVQKRLANGINPFINTGFTHDSTNFNVGVLNGAYKILPTMKDKVAGQMELVTKIRAVDTEDVARLIIERHFIRDIRGNLRKFSHQQFRCVACNEKFRRPPLLGACTKCNGKIIFTISEGSIKKYLDPAMDLATNYNISPYTREGMELTKMYIESIFGKDLEKQVELKQWF